MIASSDAINIMTAQVTAPLLTKEHMKEDKLSYNEDHHSLHFLKCGTL